MLGILSTITQMKFSYSISLTFNSFYFLKHDVDGGVETYLEHMLCPTQWGGPIEITALSQLYRYLSWICNIFVCDFSSGIFCNLKFHYALQS